LIKEIPTFEVVEVIRLSYMYCWINWW